MDLPALTRQEMLVAEYSILGLSPEDHLMGLYEETLHTQDILDSKAFLAAPDEAVVRVAGQMVIIAHRRLSMGRILLT